MKPSTPGIGESLWSDVQISSWEQFQNLAHELYAAGFDYHRTFAFRGQASDAWLLQPSLARVFHNVVAWTGKPLSSSFFGFENSMLEQLKAHANLYINVGEAIQGETRRDWLALAQHFGAPTRLLDWTFSPFVAAWFAVMGDANSDAAIWFASVKHVNSKINALPGLIFGEDRVLTDILENPYGNAKRIAFFRPRVHHPRSARQQSLFSVAGDGEIDHVELLTAFASEPTVTSQPAFGRIVVPSRLRREFVIKLRAMNVTADSLFPGLDGLCRELGERLRDHPEELDQYKRIGIETLRPPSPNPPGAPSVLSDRPSP